MLLKSKRRSQDDVVSNNLLGKLALKKENANPLLFFGVIILFIVDQTLYHPSMWPFVGVGVVYALLSQFKLPLSKSYRRGVIACLGVAVLSMLLISSTAEPSPAILLSDAQAFFSSKLATAGNASQGTAVEMIFNVARGLYIFYLIVAVVAAWNTAQRDEDWLPVIKTPVMSLMGIFSIDVMTNMIIT